jgi:hypothetical protein
MRICRVAHVDRALALNRDGFELLGIKFDIVALADFVALDDICRIDFVAPGPW